MNTKEQLSVGEQVTDPNHGFATVTFVGTEYVGLRFERDGQHALFRFEGCPLQPGWDEAALAEIDTTDEEAERPPWPDSTFIAEDEDAEHFMGAHWEPFLENGVEAYVKRLPEILPATALLDSSGGHYCPSRPEPESWPKGAHLRWPVQGGNGMVVTVRFDPDASHVIALYPLADHGARATLRLDRVRVWEGGVEAQIDAVWGEAEVTFFDTAFLLHRGGYEAGADYEFLLAGIAYAARPATQARIPYTPHPDQVAWQRMLAAERGDPPPEIPAHLDFSGTACFLPVPEWDDDEYSFRGPVKTVEAFDDFLGQAGWKVRATVMRFGDEDADADLDIYITRRAWAAEEPPAVGEDIEGRLWLQGRLSSVANAGTAGRG